MEDEIPIGSVAPWNETGRGAREDVSRFVLAIIETMRTWQDATLGTLRGNRTRTVGIRLSDDEGGLNLNMRPEVIEAVTQLGARAGDVLVDRFASSTDTPSWRAHRWARYRSTMAAATRWLEALRTAYTTTTLAGQEPYCDMIDRLMPEARVPTDALVNTTPWKPPDPGFGRVEPHPTADLRLRPSR